MARIMRAKIVRCNMVTGLFVAKIQRDIYN